MSLFSTDPSIVQFINQGKELTLKQWTRNMLDIYRDNWEYIIECELQSQFTPDNYQMVRPLITKESNPLKQVVNATAMVYKEAADRKALIDDEPDERYQEILEETPINTIMRSVNQYTRAANQVLLKTTWRNSKIDYDILNFDNVVIFTDPKDWKKIIAVKYTIDSQLPDYDNEFRDKGITNIKGLKFEKFSRMFLWSIEDNGDSSFVREFEQKDSGEPVLVSKEINPYKNIKNEYILPFTLFTKRYPDTDLLDFTTGTDVFDATVNTAINMVHLNSLIKYQSYKMIVLSSGSDETFRGKIDIDPLSVLKLVDPEGKTSASTLDLHAQIDKVWAIILARITQIMASYGIPPKAFSVSKSGQSGVSIQLDRLDLTELRESDIELYRSAERELFEITRIVNNAHSPKQIDIKAKFKIDFGETSLPVSNEEQANARAINIALNITNPIDLIKQDNPDLDDDEALAIYEENKRINQSTQSAQVAITPPQQPGAIETQDIEDNEIAGQ